MSVDFAYKAIENFYFLLPASVLALDRFMHKDFSNQHIQKFGDQLRRVDVLLHQPYPLFSVNGGLCGGFHCFVKLLNFLVQLLLFAPVDRKVIAYTNYYMQITMFTYIVNKI